MTKAWCAPPCETEAQFAAAEETMPLPLLLVVVGRDAGLGVADGRGDADVEREAVGTQARFPPRPVMGRGVMPVL